AVDPAEAGAVYSVKQDRRCDQAVVLEVAVVSVVASEEHRRAAGESLAVTSMPPSSAIVVNDLVEGLDRTFPVFAPGQGQAGVTGRPDDGQAGLLAVKISGYCREVEC